MMIPCSTQDDPVFSSQDDPGNSASCVSGQSEASLTQIGDLESELQQVQSLNARLEEDLLAAERTGSRMNRPGNGHDLAASQSGFGSVLSGSQGTGLALHHNTFAMAMCVQRSSSLACLV